MENYNEYQVIFKTLKPDQIHELIVKKINDCCYETSIQMNIPENMKQAIQHMLLDNIIQLKDDMFSVFNVIKHPDWRPDIFNKDFFDADTVLHLKKIIIACFFHALKSYEVKKTYSAGDAYKMLHTQRARSRFWDVILPLIISQKYGPVDGQSYKIPGNLVELIGTIFVVNDTHTPLSVIFAAIRKSEWKREKIFSEFTPDFRKPSELVVPKEQYVKELKEIIIDKIKFVLTTMYDEKYDKIKKGGQKNINYYNKYLKYKHKYLAIKTNIPL
jgi:hypothetical protein